MYATPHKGSLGLMCQLVLQWLAGVSRQQFACVSFQQKPFSGETGGLPGPDTCTHLELIVPCITDMLDGLYGNGDRKGVLRRLRE